MLLIRHSFQSFTIKHWWHFWWNQRNGGIFCLILLQARWESERGHLNSLSFLLLRLAKMFDAISSVMDRCGQLKCVLIVKSASALQVELKGGRVQAQQSNWSSISGWPLRIPLWPCFYRILRRKLKQTTIPTARSDFPRGKTIVICFHNARTHLFHNYLHHGIKMFLGLSTFMKISFDYLLFRSQILVPAWGMRLSHELIKWFLLLKITDDGIGFAEPHRSHFN